MYKTGNIQPFWTDEYKNLPYEQNPYSDVNKVDYWKSLGFTHTHFTGKMCIVNPDDYSWADNFFKLFNGINIGVTFYKMETGVIMPIHLDHFNTYKQIYNLSNSKNIYRSIVFLESRKNGHIFEIENKLIQSWNPGDYVLWNNTAHHAAANLGVEPRYTVQITFLNV